MTSLLAKHLPLSLRPLLETTTWQPITTGASGARVFRLHTGDTVRYLKIAPDLHAEEERLRWLQGRVPVPQVLHSARHEGRHFLLLSALPGLMPFHDALPWSPEERMRAMAQAARRFHALPVDECPFPRGLDWALAQARDNMLSGRVAEDDFDAHRKGRRASDLFQELLAARPHDEDFVVVHGDLYPVNVLVHPQTHALLGYVDVGRVGVADRYVDLALIANAIRWHYGTDYWALFFEVYGVPLDREKIDYYALLDEFF